MQHTSQSPKLTTLCVHSAHTNHPVHFHPGVFVHMEGIFSRMLRCNGQKAPCQVICGRRFESQTILELERTQQATLQMRKLRLSGLPKATQLFIRMPGFHQASLPGRREPQDSLLGKNLSAIGCRLADRRSFSIHEK